MNWRGAPPYPSNRKLCPYREHLRDGIAQKRHVDHGNPESTVKPVRRLYCDGQHYAFIGNSKGDRSDDCVS